MGGWVVRVTTKMLQGGTPFVEYFAVAISDQGEAVAAEAR